MTDTTILILREAVKPEGADPELLNIPLNYFATAEYLGLIKRTGMKAVWFAMRKGKEYLTANDTGD